MTDIQAIRTEIKNMKPHVEKKDVVQQVIKKVVPTDLEAKERAEKARKSAHKLSADVKRDISMDIKNKLSESFDFIEESCGSGSPEFEFYDTPQTVSECVVDGMPAPSYPIIGRATGVFAPIGVMSRNNRIYDNDHYDYLLGNQHLVDRISHRGMLGTIGHHDKKVDDQDLADGKVSHIVTDLHIKEEADGTRNLCGTLEILDTPAGHLLKTYYDSGVPLFVSSRGGGNLLTVPNESYKRVDKTKYFLETFDIVKNPGFLQAKPVYEKVSESTEEVVSEAVEETINPIVEEDKIDKLINAMTMVAEALLEKKEEKADKSEEGEAKEKAEAKEAKETKEAKEKAETPIAEEKKDKEDEDDKKPEDEKKDEEESAIASSVTEELSKEGQKVVDKIMDPHAGMTKKEAESGKYEQLKTLPREEVENAVKAGEKNEALTKRLQQGARKIVNNNVPQPVAKQLSVFDVKEELQKRVAEVKAGETAKEAQKAENEVKEPVTFDHADLARALKNRVKEGK